MDMQSKTNANSTNRIKHVRFPWLRERSVEIDRSTAEMEEPLIKRDVKHISKNVYITRKKELHQTQEQFAELIDMSKDTVSNIERGIVIPTMFCMVQISNATNKTVDSFLIER